MIMSSYFALITLVFQPFFVLQYLPRYVFTGMQAFRYVMAAASISFISTVPKPHLEAQTYRLVSFAHFFTINPTYSFKTP